MQTVTEECRSRNHGTLYHPGRRIAFRRLCGRWSCDDCSKRKSQLLKRRLAKISWTKLLTITMPPGRGWARRANLQYQAEHLRSFMRGLRRRYGQFRYAWVREVGKVKLECICASNLNDCQCGANGSRLHIHMLLDIPIWMDGGWLTRHAKACGLGFVDLRAVRGFGANSYISKYLAKGSDFFPPGARRYQVVGIPADPPSEGWLYSTRRIEFIVLERLGGLSCDVLTYFWHGD